MSNMDVIDLFEDLNKDRKLRDIPFLLITTEKERDKVVEAVAAAIKEYIVKKPVKPESLGNKIKELYFGAA